MVHATDVLFIGFIVAVLILIIYFVFIYKNDNRRRNAYKTKQSKSSGTADKAAIDALKEINTIERPTAEDNYNAARIEELNVLEGNLDNARVVGGGVINDIVGRFNNTLTAIQENREDNLRNQRNHRNLRARMRTDAARNGADDLFGGMADLFVVDMLFGNRGVPLHRIADPPPEVMVAHIGDFAMGGLDLILGEMRGGDDFWAPIVPPLQFMALGAQQTGSQLREDRVNIAAEGANTKEEFVKNYLDSTVTHTNDPQSSHDSSATEDLKNTLKTLRATSTKESSAFAIAQINKYIADKLESGEIDINKANAARTTLKTATNGSFITQYDEREDNILKYTWDRTNIPENAENSENGKLAIINALADAATSDNSTVCAGGRAGRYLTALATLDADPNVGAAMRSEDYKNQILGEISNLIDLEAEKAAESDDEAMRSVGKSYTDPKVAADPTAEAKFNEMLRQKIDATIDGYKEHLKPHQIEEFKRDAKAAIM